MEWVKQSRIRRYLSKYASKKKLRRAIERFPEFGKVGPTIYYDMEESGQKYIEWVAKGIHFYNYSDRVLIEIAENWDRVKHVIDNKDLFALKPSQAEEVVESAIKKVKKKELQRKRKNLLKSPSLRVDVPESHEATCILGKDTKWCISMKDDPGRFDQYDEHNIIFVITKSNSSREDIHGKMAILLDRKTGRISEIRDSTDMPMSIESFQKALGDSYAEVSAVINEHSGHTEDTVKEVVPFDISPSYYMEPDLSAGEINAKSQIEAIFNAEGLNVSEYMLATDYEVRDSIGSSFPRWKVLYRQTVTATVTISVGSLTSVTSHSSKTGSLTSTKSEANTVQREDVVRHTMHKALRQLQAHVKNNKAYLGERISNRNNQWDEPVNPWDALSVDEYLPKESPDNYQDYLGNDGPLTFPLSLKMKEEDKIGM